MLVSVLRDLHSTLTSLVSISSRTRRSRYLFTEESTTTTPLALFSAHLRCVIRFRARGSHLMHGQAWARFLGAAKGTPFTHKGRRTPSKSMRRPNISAAKPKCLVNSAPVWKFVSRGTLGGRMT